MIVIVVVIVITIIITINRGREETSESVRYVYGIECGDGFMDIHLPRNSSSCIH